MFGIYPKSYKSNKFILPVQMCMAYDVLKSAEARKKSIIEDTKSVFNVSDNLNADFSKPTIELCSQNTVRLYDHIIKTQAFRHDVDVDLIRAIMYMETSHGWYDKVYPLRKTILPMNIHYEYWKGLGFSKEKLLNPRDNTRDNIFIGTLLIKRIQDRLSDPKISKIASVYNFIGKQTVTDYGARVTAIYRSKAWIGC